MSRATDTSNSRQGKITSAPRACRQDMTNFIYTMRDYRPFCVPFLLAFCVWTCIFVEKAHSEAKPTKAEAENGELAKIENELQEKRRALERLNQMEEQTFAELLNLEERSDLTDRLISRLVSKQELVKRELQEKERSLKETDSTLCRHSESAERRLREAYKQSRLESPAIILGASPPGDLASKRRFLRRVLGQDQKILAAAEALRADLKERKLALGRVRPELSRLRRSKNQQQLNHLKQLQDKEESLRRIAAEKRLCARAICELEAKASQLRRVLNLDSDESSAEGTSDPERDGGLERMKGKLSWPIKGRVLKAFGEQKDRASLTTTENPGIEIMAEDDGEVMAVADGKVVYSSRLRGYGNFVLLEHGGGYFTLYARLSEVSVSPGEEVRRLQKIGLVGDDLAPSRRRLHFEIRRGKESVDPLEWLR